MKKHTAILLLSFYVSGALLTNAYCQVYRWHDWQEISAYNTHEKLLTATIGWPLYWASRVSIWAVGVPAENEITPKETT